VSTSPREELLKFALGYMVSKNHSVERYIKYAKLIRSQVELIQKIENRPIAVSDWIQMAIELGRQALVREIGAKRIAESIYPLVDGSGQLKPYVSFPAGPATNLLLGFTGTYNSLTNRERRFLVQIISELQNLHRKNH
tara:strand:- start:2343 stop:2756 length:414 start_codon:yes stop_codon:yes gene_type:complete